MHNTSSDQLEHLQLAAQVADIEIPQFVLPQERDVVVQRMRLHHLDWGTRGQRPMLFLHGGGLTARTWDLVCLALRRDYHCLALDQRGHGDSEWSPEMDYRFEAHLGDIEGAIDGWGLQRLILVGQSMGAMNAILYAARHADRVAALVVIDAGPEVRVEGARRIGDFMSATAEVDSVETFVAQARVFNPLRDPRLLRRSVLHNLRQRPDGMWMRKNDMRHRLDVRTLAARVAETWSDIARITCPTLVVRGASSDVFYDADAEKLARNLQRGRWVRVDDAGHTVQGDNPRGLVAAMRHFFHDIDV